MRRILIPLLVLALAAGCTTNKNSAQQRLARIQPALLYKRGEAAVKAADYKQAITYFEALTARYSFSPEAKQARFDLIHAYYRDGEKESAKDAADTFIKENPAHPRLDYIWYMKGLIDLERMPYVFEKWLNVDLSARVPKTATDAFESFQTVVKDFPQSPYAPEARRRMIYLRNRLAKYEMLVAQHYFDRGAWVAAAQRANATIEHYDGAPVVKDALRMLVSCYHELDYAELATNTEKVFRENYPNEPLVYKSDTGHRWWKLWERSKDSKG